MPEAAHRSFKESQNTSKPQEIIQRSDKSLKRTQIWGLLAGLSALHPNLAQAQEGEVPQEEAHEPPSKNETDTEKTVKPAAHLNFGVFEVTPNATLILNTTNHWSKKPGQEVTENSFEGGVKLVEGRLTGQTSPDVIPNGNLGFLIAGGAADGSAYFLGEARAQWDRLGFTGGASTHPSSALANFQHLRDTNGARIKQDASYFDLTGLPTGLDRFAEMKINAGPKENSRLLQIFGGVRSGVGMAGKWNPTAMGGFNVNMERSTMGFTGHLDQDHDFHAEAHYRRIDYANKARLRYEMILVGLINNYSVDPENNRKLAVGGSILNVVGLGENVGGDTKRVNIYNRTDIGKTGEHQPDWNTSFGVGMIPFKNIPDVILTPEVSFMSKYDIAKEARHNTARLMFNFQIKF